MIPKQEFSVYSNLFAGCWFFSSFKRVDSFYSCPSPHTLMYRKAFSSFVRRDILKKLSAIILVCCINLFVLHSILAASPSSIKKLDDLADQTLQFTILGRFEDAQHILDLFGKNFSDITKDRNALTEVEIHEIQAAQQKAIKVFDSENFEKNSASDKVTSFRLAVDAVQKEGAPLWTKMREPILETLSKAEAAIQASDTDTFDELITQMVNQFEVIAPSMKIDVKSATANALEREVKFINDYRDQVFSDRNSNKEITKLKADLEAIFREMEHVRSEPSIWWVIATTGSIIMATLSYVGWRKYKAEHVKNDGTV